MLLRRVSHAVLLLEEVLLPYRRAPPRVFYMSSRVVEAYRRVPTALGQTLS